LNKEISEKSVKSTVTNEMSFMDIFLILVSKWWIMLAVGMVFAITGFVFTKATSVPRYETDGSLYIDTKKNQVGDNSDAMSILYAQDLMPTYIEILESRNFIEDVRESVDYKYSYKDIIEMTSLFQVNETNILTIKTISYDEKDSYVICKNMVNYAKEELLRVFEEGNVKIIDLPDVEPKVVIPNATERAIIMFMFGVIVALAVLVMYNMFDTRISSADELTEKYNIPVLGEVPTLGEKS